MVQRAFLSLLLCAVLLPSAARGRPRLPGGLTGDGTPAWLQVAQGVTDDEEPPPPPDEPGTTPPAAAPGSTPRATPAPAAAPDPNTEPTPVTTKPKSDVKYGVGLHLRGIFVPFGFLDMFLQEGTGLYSAAIGGEFVRRKGNFDIVASINFGFYSPDDGNFLGDGKVAEVDTDYVVFDGLNVLAFDVAFIWRHELTSWLSLIFGAGLGLGFVLGDVLRISGAGCNSGNVSDLEQCNPTNALTPEDREMWKQDRERWIEEKAPRCEGGDDPLSPCLFVEEGVWPVVPMVHLLLGFNFQINEHFAFRLDGGFHDAFYVGGAGHYFF